MEAARKGDLLFMLSQREPFYTITDIENLPEGQRAELIAGRMYMMASPTLTHQEILLWLSAEILHHIQSNKGKCKVIPSPFGVFIKKDVHNYLEPDISVICDKNKLDQKGCHGAPDWVIEIVSPSSRLMDYQLKLSLYQEAGVREYWIVDYNTREIQVYSFRQSETPIVYTFGNIIESETLPGLALDFSRLSEYIEPKL